MIFLKITVLGSGSWGTAVACLFADIGHDITLWSFKTEERDALLCDGENREFLPGVKIPGTVKFTSDFDSLKSAELVVSAVPSHAVRQTARKIREYYNGCPILNISKGLEQHTLLRLSEVIKSEIENATVAVMSGPSHAEEVGRKLPTTNIIACADHDLAKYLQEHLMSRVFRIYTSDDIIGVELGGSLKNVIALCAGICDGLGFGDNTKAALMTRGIAEIARLGTVMGAKRETFSGLSGIGDLIVTCTSMHSRNRRAGILIGEGMKVSDAIDKVHMVVEGVRTADAAMELSKKYGVDMPICSEAYKVLFEDKPARDAVYDLMLRGKKSELE